MNKITVDINKIGLLAQEGDRFIFKPESEKQLKTLLELQQLINTTIDQVKNNIIKAGISINPNFRGVIGSNVRCIVREYGPKYSYDNEQAEPFLSKREVISVDTKKVEDYLKEKGRLPKHIHPTDRQKQISITLRNEKNAVIV